MTLFRKNSPLGGHQCENVQKGYLDVHLDYDYVYVSSAEFSYSYYICITLLGDSGSMRTSHVSSELGQTNYIHCFASAPASSETCRLISHYTCTILKVANSFT